jgi:signal transduction histidine kinase
MMQQVRRGRQLAAVGQFASQLSHEIRTPLTSLQLNLQAVNRGIRDGVIRPEMATALDICLREIRRLDRVAHGVLALGRADTDVATPCFADRIMHEALTTLQLQLERQGIAVSLDSCLSNHRVAGPAEALHTAFLNLLSNAAEAMPDGGAIEIRIDATADDPRHLQVVIADTGPGIPPEHRDRIFEPFFTTKRSGAGLGLALVSKALQACGGRIRVTTREDARPGAVFIVTLPRVQAGAA